MPTTQVTKETTNLKQPSSDLQAVYNKVIQTSDSAVIPLLRSRASSVKQRPQTQPSSTSGKLFDSDCPLQVVDDSLQKSLDSSQLTSSAEDIIITQLPFHVRERPDTSCSRTHSSNSDKFVVNSQSKDGNKSVNKPASAYYRPGKNQMSRKSLSKAAAAEYWTSVYSAQSMRFVTEQVALEQARQRKRLASIQEHRIDRKYLVNGSGFFGGQVFNLRTNSAPRIRFSRSQFPKNSFDYLCRRKPSLDLVVNGCGKMNSNVNIEQTAAQTCKRNNEEKKINQGSSCRTMSAEEPSSLTKTQNTSEKDSLAINDKSSAVETVSVDNKDGGNTSNENYTHKIPEKPVRSVTFTLPNEESVCM